MRIVVLSNIRVAGRGTKIIGRRWRDLVTLEILAEERGDGALRRLHRTLSDNGWRRATRREVDSMSTGRR